MDLAYLKTYFQLLRSLLGTSLNNIWELSNKFSMTTKLLQWGCGQLWDFNFEIWRFSTLASYSQAPPKPTLIVNCETILHKRFLSYLQTALGTFKMDKTVHGKDIFDQLYISDLESWFIEGASLQFKSHKKIFLLINSWAAKRKAIIFYLFSCNRSFHYASANVRLETKTCQFVLCLLLSRWKHPLVSARSVLLQQ